MTYLLTYKGEQMCRVEITDQQKLIDLVNDQEGRVVDDPIKTFFEAICQAVYQHEDGNYGFLEDYGVKLTKIYNVTPFEKSEVKAELL